MITVAVKCPCPVCGEDVTPDQQYMIGHDMMAGSVIHTVSHMDCLTIPEQGRLPENPQTAAPVSKPRGD